MKLAAVALLLALQQAPFSEVLEVRRHNVDVIVTDKQGNHVGGLRAEDFEILEDGKPQEVTNFAEFADPSIKRVPANPGEPLPAVQAPPPRKFVIFIDEMSLHPSTRRKFAQSVAELIDRTMGPQDEAAVVVPSDRGKVKVEFMRDRAAIRAAVGEAMSRARFRFDSAIENEKRMLGIDMGNAGNSPGALRAAARRNAGRVRARVEHRLGNLRGVVSALADQPGRKVIVLTTESLPSQPGREMFRAIAATLRENPNVLPAALNGGYMTDQQVGGNSSVDQSKADYYDQRPVMEEIARSASAHGITIYCLQPAYVSAPQGLGSVENRGSSGSTVLADLTNLDSLDNNDETMEILTGRTGGKWYRGDLRVDNAFRQVALDVQSYYSMAYRAEGGLDTPHKVTVRVRNRPDLNVRARNEVVRRSIRNEVTDRVVASLVGEEPPNELGIGVRSGGVQSRGRDAATAKIDVLVPLSKLMFVEQDGTHRASFTVHYAVSGEEKDFISGMEPEQVVEIPKHEFAKAQAGHWRYTLTLNVRREPHRVGVGVLDPQSHVWGIETVELDAR